MIFLYYFPATDRAAITPAFVRAAGLGDVGRDCLAPRVWDDRTARANVHQRGPDGSSGAILAFLPVDDLTPDVGHFPDRQVWRPVGDPIKYWIGHTPSDPPRPETLRRAHVVPGYDVELPDGHVWTCPTIRRYGRQFGVPTQWGVDACGQFTESVLPDYAAFWELSGEMLDAALGGRDWNTAQYFDAAARCLGLNYRLGPHEITALGLLTSDTFARVFKAAVDGDALQAYFDSPDGRAALAAAFQDDPTAKKKTDAAAPAGTNSTPGPSADCPISAPPAPS